MNQAKIIIIIFVIAAVEFIPSMTKAQDTDSLTTVTRHIPEVVTTPEIENPDHNINIYTAFGFSTYTGVAGIEFQMDHFALGGGYISIFGEDESGPTGGIRYYFSKTGGSWYIGASGTSTEGKDDNGLMDESKMYGGFIGYRWFFGRAMNFDLGLGYGAKKYVDRTPGGTKNKSMTFPAGGISVGYSFL